MKKILKILKWIGLTIVGLLLIVAVYLGITGFPKPSAITTENVPRVSVTYANNIFNAYNNYKSSVRFIDWAPEEDEKIYIRYSEGMGVLDSPNATPKPVEGWPTRNPIFHPDSEERYFLYTQDNSEGNETYQIYLYDLDSKTSKMLTNGEDRHGYPRIIPNTDKILFTRRSLESTEDALYLMDVNNPSSESKIFETSSELYGDGTIYIDDFSPDGNKVAIRLGYNNTIPSVLDLLTGDLNLLEKEEGQIANHTYHEWSANGKKLYYGSSIHADFSQLRVRDLETGADSVLLKNINWDVSNISESPDGNWLVFQTNEDGTSRLNIHHVSSGKTEGFELLPDGSIPYAQFNPNSKATVAFPISYFSGETDIFSYNLESKELKQWTNNKKDNNFTPHKVIRYSTFDIDTTTGRQRVISAMYYKPTEEFKVPYPVIINLHGGPKNQVKTGYDPIIEFNTKRGIAVIAPNFRGSRGYGFNFMNLDNGKGREGAIKDIGALLDWVEKQPELDASRVILDGGSYGGYLSLICASRYSDRIIGAIDWYGMSDLVLFLEGDKNADRTDEYGDTEDPEIRDFLKRISPINNVAEIDVPVFIFQGERDARVLVDQSRNMVEALKNNNKDVWYIEASNEGHQPSNPWNIIYTKSAEFTFVDKLFFNDQ